MPTNNTSIPQFVQPDVSGSYYALLDEDGNIVQLCKTEKGAKNAFYKFKTEFYNTGFYIENIIVD